MYGSVDQQQMDESITNIPLVAVEESKVDISEQIEDQKFLKYPFDEVFDETFWGKVTEKFNSGVGWAQAMDRVRLDSICEKFKKDNKEPLVTLLTETHDKYVRLCTHRQGLSAFVLKLYDFAKLLIEDDFSAHENDADRLYAWNLAVPKMGKRSVLHLSAERNLTNVAQAVLDRHPALVYLKSSHTKKDSSLNDKTPVEVALKHRHDDVASLLLKNMMHKRVRSLFIPTELFEAPLKLSDIVTDPSLKKTVPAILDCMINTEWPFVPLRDEEKSEEEWSSIPQPPSQYHFYYRLLDGDQNGEPARIAHPTEPGETVRNPEFNVLQPSCLQLLVDGEHSEVAMCHPIVRMLVNRKWEKFGRMITRVAFCIYLLFLLFLSIALFIDYPWNSVSYTNGKDYTRAFFEVVTLIMTVVYFLSEVDEMCKEGRNYWKDFFNWMDLLGLILIFLMLPLRFAHTDTVHVELSVAAAAYLVNFLLVFKYFPVFRKVGIYSKTFAQIIYYDITKFALIFGIVLFAFAGSLYLATQAAAKRVPNAPTLSFAAIILREVRALAEGNPFEDDYSGFHVAVVILIMVNMLAIIVVLANILIGQLSYRYERAMESAGLQYSIDKTKFIMKIERSRFEFTNSRIRHYVDGDYLCDETLIGDLVTDWNLLQPTHGRSEAVRNYLARIVSNKKDD